MSISCVILEHYPEYEERAINSAKDFDEIILIKDYDTCNNYSNEIIEKLVVIDSENDLLSKINKAIEITKGKFIFLLDGDDYMNKGLSIILELIDQKIEMNTMYKFNNVKKHISYKAISNENIVKILNKNYDWHISGTLFYNSGKFKFEGTRSIDKQLFFNALNLGLNIELYPNRILTKSYNYKSVMKNTSKFDFETETINAFKKLKENSRNRRSRHYASLVILNSTFRISTLTFRNVIFGIFVFIKLRYYKPLLNLMVIK